MENHWKITRKALRLPQTVSIIGIYHGFFIMGIYPWIFPAELGRGIRHFSQVIHKMIAASWAGSRGEVKGGVGPCGRYRRVMPAPWDAPPRCLMQLCSHLLSSAVAHGKHNAANHVCC